MNANTCLPLQNFHEIVETVQTNCHITDARHAQDMTMCIFLLEMREYYRWEYTIPFAENLPKDDLGSWMVEREKLWATLEDSPYQTLQLASGSHDPFDVAAINRDLVPQGYVYSAGLGRFRRPHFFLGRLHRAQQRDGFEVLVADCEYARDLIAPPAALLGNTIYIRREAVKSFLWTKVEEWGWKQQDNALGRALAYYDFKQQPDAELERMTDAESEAMILHELGEGQAGRALDDAAWNEMLITCSRHRPELYARAVRDNLADCLVTLPTLMEQASHPSLHFYFANFEGMRKKLFPLLVTAYQAWVQHGDLEPLQQAVERGRQHWLQTAQEMIAARHAGVTDTRLVEIGEGAGL
jgi:hypothetical protein